VNGMTVEQRFQLCRSIGEECISGVSGRVDVCSKGVQAGYKRTAL
jgi:hypothetical protein